MSLKNLNRKNIYIFIITLITIFIVYFSLNIGPNGISFLVDLIKENNFNIISYRLSRLLLSIIAGSSLAMSGASLQGLFRNPLADPHIFGVSGGASLGASLVIAFGGSSTLFLPKIGAILGGFFSFLIIFYFLKRAKNNEVNQCLLVGILINSMTASVITLLKIILPIEKTQNLLFWLVGNISSIEKADLIFILPIWLLGLTLLWCIKNNLAILAFGEEEATLLGLDFKKMSQTIVIANSLLIGCVVSFAGMIGFVGLVIPHLVRHIFGPSFSRLLPLSMFFGALTMVFFDTLSRLSFWWISSEIPVGALCALFLSPVFVFLLFKSNHDDSTGY